MNPDPDPVIFDSYLQKANKKTNLKRKFFCLLLFEGTFTSFFKDKKSKRSHKTVGMKVLLTFLLDDRRIRIRIRIHTSDSDPDPEEESRFFLLFLLDD